MEVGNDYNDARAVETKWNCPKSTEIILLCSAVALRRCYGEIVSCPVHQEQSTTLTEEKPLMCLPKVIGLF